MASEEFKRGQQIISAEEAAKRSQRLLPLDDFGLTWGGLELPSTEAVTHFCVVGTTGSGKTTLLRLLMQSCLPLIGADYKEKSYKVSRTEYEEPSTREKAAYEKAQTDYQAAVATREQKLKRNREQIAAVREHNRVIRDRRARASDKRAEVEEELKGLAFHGESQTGRIIGMTAIVVIANSWNGLFQSSLATGPWGIHIAAQYLLGFVFLVLYLRCITSIYWTIELNDKVKAQQKSLGQKRDELARQQEAEEKPEPERLNLPEVPRITFTPPLPKPVAKTEDKNPKPYSGPGHRAIIFDAKGDIISLLYGMQLTCPIHILNPFDARSTAWDIAKDFTTPASARQFATILVPEDKKSSQPFFSNSARDLIGHVILSLIHLKPEEWTLRDLILATQSKASLISLLSNTPQGKVKIETYFDDHRTGSNTMSEIATRMAPFESVAQAWSYATKRISLKEWINEESILILGSNEEHRAALDPINRVFFQRATELVLSQSESSARRTWFFLDEVRDLGDLESLGRLMTKGRSKGACVVLGFQDIEGMHDAFGKERANEFIGQCANKAVLRLSSPETAKWASELFGKYEFIEDETGENKGGSKTTGKTETAGSTTGATETTGTSKGTSTGTSKGVAYTEGSSSGSSRSFGGGTSAPTSSTQSSQQRSKQTSEQQSEQKSEQTSESVAKQTSEQKSMAENASDTDSWTQTVNKKRMEKDALMASQFITIPVTNPRNGLHAYYLTPSIGAFYGVLSGVQIKNSLRPPHPYYSNYEPLPPSQQYLQEWTNPEREALGLPKVIVAPSKTEDAAVAATSNKPGNPGLTDGGVGRFASKTLRPITDFER